LDSASRDRRESFFAKPAKGQALATKLFVTTSLHRHLAGETLEPFVAGKNKTRHGIFILVGPEAQLRGKGYVSGGGGYKIILHFFFFGGPRPASSRRRPPALPPAMGLDAGRRCGYFQVPRHGLFVPGEPRKSFPLER
jgi:hypothetical protein